MPNRPKTEQELKRAVLEGEARMADEKMEARIMKMLDDHEERIRVVEQWQWKQIGIYAVLGAILTIGATSWISGEIQSLRQLLPAPAAASRR